MDERNTIEIRKQLYREAFQLLLPQLALIRIGLDRFKERPSCLSEKNEVHNSALQVAIEFGWPAGIAFSVLMLLAGRTALLRAPAKPRGALRPLRADIHVLHEHRTWYGKP